MFSGILCDVVSDIGKLSHWQALLSSISYSFNMCLQIEGRLKDPFKQSNKGRQEGKLVLQQVSKNDGLAKAIGGWDKVTCVKVIGKNNTVAQQPVAPSQ